MHATVHTFSRQPAAEMGTWAHALVNELHPEAPPAIVLRSLSGIEGLVVGFWPDEPTAAKAVTRTGPAAFSWLTADLMGVDDDFEGQVREGLSFATVAWFSGPRSAAELDLLRLGNRRRIHPAVRQVPGHGRSFVLVGPDATMLVVALAVSVEALRNGRRAIMGTKLLADEDPSLVTRPTSAYLAEVAYATLPALVSRADNSLNMS